MRIELYNDHEQRSPKPRHIIYIDIVFVTSSTAIMAVMALLSWKPNALYNR